MSDPNKPTISGENEEKVLDERVESLAIPLARDYAEKNYKKREDGTFEPAWRGVNGEKELRGKSPEDLIAEGWSEMAARDAVIDIANQPYNEFSEYWKEQNRGGAEYLIKLLDENGKEAILGLDLEDEETRAKFGTLIHENWISRNEWVKHPEYGNPELAKPFVELDPVEQQKDIDQLGVLQKWLEQQDDNPTETPSEAQETTNEQAEETPEEILETINALAERIATTTARIDAEIARVEEILAKIDATEQAPGETTLSNNNSSEDMPPTDENGTQEPIEEDDPVRKATEKTLYENLMKENDASIIMTSSGEWVIHIPNRPDEVVGNRSSEDIKNFEDEKPEIQDAVKKKILERLIRISYGGE
ncbi:hypothetical protein IKG45_02390 [Candidatus Saccharibacteria bacterium]|nr:hypothetical protein [Candidatus Saccharibacteria bacterium]